MSDIVERLLAEMEAYGAGSSPVASTLRAQADEIVRLRAERDRLRDASRQGQEDMRRRAVEVAQARVHNATEWDSSYWDQAAQNISLAIAALKVGDTP